MSEEHFPEARHIAFTNYVSQNGFTWNVTVRANDLVELRDVQTNWEEYITEIGGSARANTSKPSASANTGHTCEKCGQPAAFKEGVSKSGKDYKGIFCSDRDSCGHVAWQ